MSVQADVDAEYIAAEQGFAEWGRVTPAERQQALLKIADAIEDHAEDLVRHTSWIRREPIGVSGQVTPWNYPMMMAMWKIAPALAAGNSVVLKPSDTTPETTLLLAELAAPFLPAGTFNVVVGDRSTGAMVAGFRAWKESPSVGAGLWSNGRHAR